MLLTSLPYPESGKEFSELGKGIEDILKYLMSPELQKELFLLKIVMIVISAIFLFLIVYFLSHSSLLDWKIGAPVRDFFSSQAGRKEKIGKHWEKIGRDMEKAEIDSQWKLALINGLQIFNRGLRMAGFDGRTLREQVDKINSKQLSNLEEVKEIVSVCEHLVEDPEYYIDKKRAKQIMKIFEKSLKELEIL